MVLGWRLDVRGEVRRDDHAVSEVVGTILLVAITIILAGGFALLLGAFGGPTARPHVDIDVTINEGSGAWGTGDEQVALVHEGGEALEADEIRVVIRVGSTEFEYSGDTLGGAFSDGSLSIGERWTVELNIPTGTPVQVNVVSNVRGGSTLTTAAELRSPGEAPDCSADTTAPTVSTWLQTPADLTTDHSGAVTVRVTLTDDCAGVDTATSPHLESRVNDGSDPPFTDAGAMSIVSGTTWQGSIAEPAGGWGSATGETLEYRVTQMTDLLGNAGTSGTQSDVVQDPALTVYTYPDTPPAITTGTVANYSNLQSASDGGAFATMTEESVSSTTEDTRTGTSSSGGSGTNHANAKGSPDGAYAVVNDPDEVVRVGTFGSGSGTITKVELLYTGSYTGSLNNDEVRLSYRISGSATGSSQEYLPTSSDTTEALDVTSDRATWTWGDISNLEVVATYIQQNNNAVGQDDGIDIRVDSLRVHVTTSATVYNLNVQMNFTAVPGGSAHVLELRYQTSVDTFKVQVQQSGGSWVDRGTTLSSPSTLSTWTYTLTNDEYQSGSPKIRIVDSTSSTSQGQILLDYVRVATS